ncbi:hypothetical protein MTO96_025555 [Rhipicephalus appendiculatus]
MEIGVGARFASYDDFYSASRKLQLRTNALFVKKTSKSADVVNTHLVSGAVKLEGKLEVHQRNFHKQARRTMKKDCPARIVIAARRASQDLEVTSVVLEHDHETTSDMLASYPECRRLNEHEAQVLQPLLELNVRPSLIVQKLNEDTGEPFSKAKGASSSSVDAL